MKTCSRCGKEKDRNEFGIDNRSKDGRYSWCRLCKSEYRNQNKEAINLKRKVYDSMHKEEKRMRDHLYYENNKERLLNRSYLYCRNASYNINQKEFDEMLEKQGGVCAICGKEETSVGRVTKRRQPLSVDHDHNTGRIRGLLCKNCNHGLGSFFDNESLLIEAANYLKYSHAYITHQVSTVVKTSPDNNKLDIHTLEYAAKWIENSLVGETNERVIEFGKNMAMSIRAAKPSVSDVSVTQDVSTDIKTPQSIENTNPDYYKDELYLDEDFRMLAKTYPADVSAIGVTTLIDYVEAVEAELARRINELHYANTVCMEQKHKIARRDEIITKLKEDAERLADGYEQIRRDAVPYCVGCKEDVLGGNDFRKIEHTDWCSVTLHRALMKELE